MTEQEILVKRIQSVLSPDLLNKEWLKKQTHPLSGHCYVASEALWYLLEDNSEWKPMMASCYDEGEKITHWWLENKITGEILDPTKEQYENESPPYLVGKGCGFLTKTPSKRAKIVIDRINKIYDRIPIYY